MQEEADKRKESDRYEGSGLGSEKKRCIFVYSIYKRTAFYFVFKGDEKSSQNTARVVL